MDIVFSSKSFKQYNLSIEEINEITSNSTIFNNSKDKDREHYYLIINLDIISNIKFTPNLVIWLANLCWDNGYEAKTYDILYGK